MVVRDETVDESRPLMCGVRVSVEDRPFRWDEEEAAELLEGTEVMKRLLADMPAMREDHRRRVRSISFLHTRSRPLFTCIRSRVDF